MLHVLALATALSPALAWRQVGPAVAGGRVAAVAGTDSDPLLYYLGSAGGGVFRTTNGGLTWDDVWPANSVGAIGAVAIAPHHPNIVWVGTGESAPRNDASYGDGVWRSVDGGRHWKQVGLSGSYAVSRILVDPHDPNVALVGVLGNPFLDSDARGVYLTRDGGRTWHRTLYAGPQSGISDMACDSLTCTTVYAGVWQFRRQPWTFTSGGAIDGLYKSTDGGSTWHQLRTGGLPEGMVVRIGVAIAPSDPRRVYALIQSQAGLLWRSDDSGAHWRMMQRNTLVDQRPFYMSRLAVDPSNHDHVFFASENLIETRDGGRTIREIHSAVHQDHHDFWISHDGRRVIEADDGGAPISVDGGKTWDWRFNVPLAQTYHVGYDDGNPYTVCGAFQDNDSFCGPSRSLSPLGITARDWRDVANNSDGVWVWPEPGDPNSIWNAGVNELNGQLGIFDLTSRQNYDITPSVTDTNGRALAGLEYRFNWESPLAFSRTTPGVAYFGANVVFETRDRGKTWQRISPDITRNDPSKQQLAGGPINTDISGAEFYDTLLDIAPSPFAPGDLWVGTDDGMIVRSVEGGAHWLNVTPSVTLSPSKGWGRVECVEPSSVSPQRAYAVVDRHLLGDRTPYVFATEDGGKSWRRIDRGLPHDEYAHVVREDPVNPDILYAGLEQGVWFSTDRGAHWQSLQLNMPAVSIHDLRIQPREHDLIAGTHGRGMWILDDLTALERLPAAERAAVPVIFPVRTAHTWYMWWASGYPTHDDGCCPPSGEFSGTDPPYGAIVSYYLPREVRGGVVLEIRDASGQLVRTLHASGGVGLHRVAWDLGSEPPVPWHRTGEWNRGPSSGPTVVPGTYLVILRYRRTPEQSVVVAPDPRAHWTQDQYVARYRFLRELNDELSQIDVALNRLDSLRAHGSGSLRSQIGGVYAQLTSGVVNSEDDMLSPDRVRERLTILQGDVALSQGPPLPPHLREAAAIRLEFQRAMAAYNQLLTRSGITASEGRQ
jgi:photosystem II stability/assembly factor-like uncharacterized protein